MEFPSLSSSVASTVPSVLENSDYEQKSTNIGDSYVNYDDEQFESEGEHEQESVVAATASSKSSSSKKYRSYEFEEAEATIDYEDTEQSSTEENDYEYESFEQEKPSEDKQNEKHLVASQESDGGQNDDELLTALQQDFNPKLDIWCSRTIHELKRKADQAKQVSHQSRVRKTEKVSDKISAGVLQNLIYRASNSNLPHHQHGVSCLHYRQKFKAPSSLMQRARTNLWLAKSSGYSTPNDKIVPETFSTPTPTVAHMFYSIKRDKLLGQLATIQIYETSKKWTAPGLGCLSLGTLDFVQMVAVKQREVSFANGSTENRGGRMLHRVAMNARLQIDESITLRRQADMLLGRANIA